MNFQRGLKLLKAQIKESVTLIQIPFEPFFILLANRMACHQRRSYSGSGLIRYLSLVWRVRCWYRGGGQPWRFRKISSLKDLFVSGSQRLQRWFRRGGLR